jgi:hypothetical protein
LVYRRKRILLVKERKSGDTDVEAILCVKNVLKQIAMLTQLVDEEVKFLHSPYTDNLDQKVKKI